jgi:molybdopterin synthase catalytic subunit
MRAEIVERPLDPAALLREVESDASGASVLFVGTVREVNDGRAVTGIDYSAYSAMAVKELAAIVDEAAERFGTPHVVVEHRLGALGLGEASVVIAISHARRAPAMEGARFVIEELKRRVPIWKREHYADGTREWVDPTIGARSSVTGARDDRGDAPSQHRAPSPEHHEATAPR